MDAPLQRRKQNHANISRKLYFSSTQPIHFSPQSISFGPFIFCSQVLQVQQQQQLGSVLFQYWLKPKNKELSEKKFFVPPTFYSVIFKYFSF
jgi:hypothetical protein